VLQANSQSVGPKNISNLTRLWPLRNRKHHMPGPDPSGLDIEEYENGGFNITAEIWAHGNRRHRIARLNAIARKIRFGGWRCPTCDRPVPLYRRADAKFCTARCRKVAARARRAQRHVDASPEGAAQIITTGGLR
jgi:hypothetical protein